MDDKLKDLLKSSNINTVTESIQQPPSGVEVKATTDKSVEANVLNQAEATEQKKVKAYAKAKKPKADYSFTIEHGSHKLEITPEVGGVYNYHAKCSCAWEGRFLTTQQAETVAKQHVMLSRKV